MSNRYIIGRLAEDPEARQAGRVQVVALTVLENTATYRGSERIEGHKPLSHHVEAKFELGSHALASLHKGDAVIVIGHERDASFEGKDSGTVFRRVIDAAHIGPDLARATAVITRVQSAKSAAPEPAADEEPTAATEELADTPDESSTGTLWGQP